jgi:hypothetical protein
LPDAQAREEESIEWTSIENRAEEEAAILKPQWN